VQERQEPRRNKTDIKREDGEQGRGGGDEDVRKGK
jgi:hypothetical protein